MSMSIHFFFHKKYPPRNEVGMVGSTMVDFVVETGGLEPSASCV